MSKTNSFSNSNFNKVSILKKTKCPVKIWVRNARVIYYRYICSRLIEIYDENKKYLFDVYSIDEFNDMFIL